MAAGTGTVGEERARKCRLALRVFQVRDIVVPSSIAGCDQCARRARCAGGRFPLVRAVAQRELGDGLPCFSVALFASGAAPSVCVHSAFTRLLRRQRSPTHPSRAPTAAAHRRRSPAARNTQTNTPPPNKTTRQMVGALLLALFVAMLPLHPFGPYNYTASVVTQACLVPVLLGAAAVAALFVAVEDRQRDGKVYS